MNQILVSTVIAVAWSVLLSLIWEVLCTVLSPAASCAEDFSWFS